MERRCGSRGRYGIHCSRRRRRRRSRGLGVRGREEEEEEKGRRREEFLCVGLGYKRGGGEDVGCFGWEWHAIFAVWF